MERKKLQSQEPVAALKRNGGPEHVRTIMVQIMRSVLRQYQQAQRPSNVNKLHDC